MPELFEWFDRVKLVEREFYAVARAVTELRNAVRSGKVAAPDRTTLRDLEAAFGRLEPTYLMRMWAEFETAVRSYYGSLTHDPDPHIRSADLINAVAGLRRGRAVADALRVQVHEVRAYRNLLVHERDDPAQRVALDEARRRLNSYLAKLPGHWD
jgi:hypothetical protein